MKASKVSKKVFLDATALFVLPFLLIVRSSGPFQTYLPYVGRNKTLRAMYRLTNPQATNNRLAFLFSQR